MTALRDAMMPGKLSPIHVLLVMFPGSPVCDRMRKCLESLQLPVAMVANCRAARDFLRSRREPIVVLTTVTLPDGNWCDLLTCVVRSDVTAGVVVYSQTVDERLWSEAIWRGASDVLVAPFDTGQVRWCIESVGRALTNRRALAISDLS
jgi:DNA-binding NtrC family response regulator